jgi:hypothetical protein
VGHRESPTNVKQEQLEILSSQPISHQPVVNDARKEPKKRKVGQGIGKPRYRQTGSWEKCSVIAQLRMDETKDGKCTKGLEQLDRPAESLNRKRKLGALDLDEIAHTEKVRTRARWVTPT